MRRFCREHRSVAHLGGGKAVRGGAGWHHVRKAFGFWGGRYQRAARVEGLVEQVLAHLSGGGVLSRDLCCALVALNWEFLLKLWLFKASLATLNRGPEMVWVWDWLGMDREGSLSGVVHAPMRLQRSFILRFVHWVIGNFAFTSAARAR